jgi:hypothetical protein
MAWATLIATAENKSVSIHCPGFVDLVSDITGIIQNLVVVA